MQFYFWFFCSPKFFRPIGEKLFLGLFDKAYFSYNIHVRHFAFGQCIVYIVSNKTSFHFFIFLFIYFCILKKRVFVKNIRR